MPPLLEIRSLDFFYDRQETPVFSALSLQVNQGELVRIKGVSGSGKSTLLRLICRLQTYQNGSILFKGTPVESMVPAELRRSIIYVAQIPSMIDASVKDNLLFPFSFSSNSHKCKPADGELLEMLEAFYLQDIGLDHQARNLSIGQQQRIALMRALLLDPEILLLDEPTSALDSKSASMIFASVDYLNQVQGKTILMVTHSHYHSENAAIVSYVLENNKLRKE
ncbi:MAG: ATP-binding cassette domain-containing protein [Chlorobium phaeobacteroides]|uniref:ABC transporter-related protein n=1 Tax=Chlorobium phaeobacteroides (strain BS1) TaxID=331678 RepID=B3EJ77_CHLPB|nr:ATP-binding cassette domain-containing protein [Chlorobium phaeobacteroides]MBL6957250.1 ATP-binding cassette domain-containing protein [Chlorobium phaeobacteroides]